MLSSTQYKYILPQNAMNNFSIYFSNAIKTISKHFNYVVLPPLQEQLHKQKRPEMKKYI